MRYSHRSSRPRLPVGSPGIRGERNFFGKEMVFEGITVLFLFYVAQSAIAGVGAFLNLPDEVAAAIAPGIAAVIAYFGPGGIQAGLVAVWNWWSTRGSRG